MAERTGAAREARPLRILEIGARLFQVAVPQQTDFFFAGRKKRRDGLFGPLSLFRVLARLRRRDYDLVVIDAPLLPHWHPRSFLTALREWHVQSLSALFAIAAVRYMHHFHDVPLAIFDDNDSFGIGAHNFGLIGSRHGLAKLVVVHEDQAGTWGTQELVLGR